MKALIEQGLQTADTMLSRKPEIIPGEDICTAYGDLYHRVNKEEVVLFTDLYTLLLKGL